MAKFFEGNPEWAGLFGVVEEGSKFAFCCGGDNLPHHMAENMNRTVSHGL
jgi:hypothetical protein